MRPGVGEEVKGGGGGRWFTPRLPQTQGLRVARAGEEDKVGLGEDPLEVVLAGARALKGERGRRRVGRWEEGGGGV